MNIDWFVFEMLIDIIGMHGLIWLSICCLFKNRYFLNSEWPLFLNFHKNQPAQQSCTLKCLPLGGNGGGIHSLAIYFFCSYLALIKFSNPESVWGRRKLSDNKASYTARARELPICWRQTTCSGLHVSKLTDLTRDIWTPEAEKEIKCVN